MPSIFSLSFTLNAIFLILVNAAPAAPPPCPITAYCGGPFGYLPNSCIPGYYLSGSAGQPNAACHTCGTATKCTQCANSAGVKSCDRFNLPLSCVPGWGYTMVAGTPTCIDCSLTGGWSGGLGSCNACAALTCNVATGAALSCVRSLHLYKGTCISCRPMGHNPDPRCIG